MVEYSLQKFRNMVAWQCMVGLVYLQYTIILPPMVGMMRCEASFCVLRKACGITKVTGKNEATMI